MKKEINKMASLSELKELNKSDFNKMKEWKEDEYQKIRYDLGLLREGQKINHKDLRLSFIGLAKQNSELLDLNKKLNQQLERVVKELNILKKEREEKVALKEARANRKRLSKRQPITPEIYQLLTKAAENLNYTSVRLRIAFCLLTVTGIQINELLSLKVGQLQTLLESHWIGIDSSKRGPANYKTFLTRKGKKLVDQRKKDFEFLFLMKNLESYIFLNQIMIKC
jgi:integrase